MQLLINNNDNFDISIEASFDGINYIELDHTNGSAGSQPSISLENINFYKYYRIRNASNIITRIRNVEFTNYSFFTTAFGNIFTIDNNGQTFTNNQRVLVETPNIIDLDGVATNIINNVPCDTLLQPSTKYELIYKADENKFIFGNLTDKQPLFDITLTEAVNQVDLTGITNMLKIGKLYELIIIGIVTTSGNAQMGSDNFAYLYQNANNPCALTMFTFDGTYIVGFRTYTDSSGGRVKSQILNNENIRLSGTNTFKIGTRIIIKEVA